MTHKKNKVIIGVTGPDKKDKFMWWLTKLAVQLSGGIAKRITPSSQPINLDQYHGFIISGGQDINPEFYGESAALKSSQYDLKRDAMEQQIIKHAIENSVPILGICRGMQMINVTLGGSLYQEVSEVLEDFLPNKKLISKIIGRRLIKIEPNTLLASIFGDRKYYSVNSIHHQAVNQLGENLVITAKEENNLIQAIEGQINIEHPFILGIQWHPEFMLHTQPARSIFKALVSKASQ